MKPVPLRCYVPKFHGGVVEERSNGERGPVLSYSRVDRSPTEGRSSRYSCVLNAGPGQSHFRDNAEERSEGNLIVDGAISDGNGVELYVL